MSLLRKNAILLRRPLGDFLMQFYRFTHNRPCLRAYCIYGTDQHAQIQILLELHTSVREDFNLQPPQSKSGLIEEAADHGNGPEVVMYKTALSEISRAAGS